MGIQENHPEYPYKTRYDQRAKKLRFKTVKKRHRYDEWDKLPVKERDYFRALIVVEDYALGDTPDT
jgi:hypothetical protein|tara:strand:- start:33 stop:230 length:198 start_codon:yes stop_codon:yes gene_type:complete